MCLLIQQFCEFKDIKHFGHYVFWEKEKLNLDIPCQSRKNKSKNGS